MHRNLRQMHRVCGVLGQGRLEFYHQLLKRIPSRNVTERKAEKLPYQVGSYIHLINALLFHLTCYWPLSELLRFSSWIWHATCNEQRTFETAREFQNLLGRVSAKHDLSTLCCCTSFCPPFQWQFQYRPFYWSIW